SAGSALSCGSFASVMSFAEAGAVLGYRQRTPRPALIAAGVMVGTAAAVAAWALRRAG
ncbi:MAG: hypothetical protein K0S15_1003, partial [Solirubrobacterales bacterium]|nr:hypothetical protein [Solirubrobacterales bacterium]